MGYRIVCYGDSNTYGYDPRSCLGGRYPETIRWTALLKSEGWEIIDEGMNGRSIPRLDREIEAAMRTILRANGSALVVMLGSNDLLQFPGITAEVCGGRIEKFLSTVLAEARDSVKVLMVAPPPMKPGAWVSDPSTLKESHRLAGCYQTAAQRLGAAFANAGEWGIELAYDGVHFSEKGHRAFAQGMRAALSGLNER